MRSHRIGAMAHTACSCFVNGSLRARCATPQVRMSGYSRAYEGVGGQGGFEKEKPRATESGRGFSDGSLGEVKAFPVQLYPIATSHSVSGSTRLRQQLGSLAMFAAIRRDSSRVSKWAADPSRNAAKDDALPIDGGREMA
jgi:hypothetical protein